MTSRTRARPTLAIALVLGGSLAACAGAPVAILTADVVYAGDSFQPGCYTSGTTGELVVDEAAGTAILEDMYARRVTVIWPAGYTARRSGAEVEVLDRKGQVTARTGTHVNFAGGYPPHPDAAFLVCNLELIN